MRDIMRHGNQEYKIGFWAEGGTAKGIYENVKSIVAQIGEKKSMPSFLATLKSWNEGDFAEQRKLEFAKKEATEMLQQRSDDEDIQPWKNLLEELSKMNVTEVIRNSQAQQEKLAA